MTQPIHFGSVYRPNDGDISSFHDQLNTTFTALPKTGTFIMGDYNIDLLKNRPNHDYEECMYSSGFSPVISIPTHIKQNCKKSCIDNIITNETDSILFTGTLTDNITHHLPIFQFSDIDSPQRDCKEKHTQYYDFSEKMHKILLRN